MTPVASTVAASQMAVKSGTWFAGADTVLRFTFSGIDVTGWALEWTCRRAAGESGAALITKTSAAGIAIVSGTVVDVSIAAADSAKLLPGVYQHALARTGAGNARPLAYGYAVLEKAATP
jgi:hypothetical protein